MSRIVPRESDRGPAASWAHAKQILETDRIHRGWFFDHGLDDDFDDAARRCGWALGIFDHMKGGPRRHWMPAMPCQLYVLIMGVPYITIDALSRNDIAYSGLGCRWADGPSKLGAMVIHPDLLRNGYEFPVPLMVSSRTTQDLLDVLLAHNTVLTEVEAAASAAGNEREFDFWEVAVPFGLGKKTSRGKEGKTSPVTPIICAHPPTAGRSIDYLRGLLAPPLVRKIIVAHWPAITSWASAVATVRHVDSGDE